MSAVRALRADAQRNRDAILSAARDTFDEEGVLASLDGIALRAGVGNATLYRNFPTRDDLLAAVMQINIDEAVSDADELLATLGPRNALAEWLFRLTWQLRIWHDLPYCVATAHADPDSTVTSAVSPLVTRTGILLDEAKSTGDVDAHVTADEVYELALTLSWGVDRFQDDERTARRRVSVATAGLYARNE